MSGKKVVVIGAGLAGIAAAARAKTSGLAVTVIAAGGGGSAFSSGALDVAGDFCPPGARPDAVSVDLKKNLTRLVLAEPSHPYALLVPEATSPAEAILKLLEETFARLFPADGLLQLEGDLESNQACFTTLGTVKFTARFPSRTARPTAAGLERPRVIGVRGYADFEPKLWARVAQENAARLGHHLSAATVNLNWASDRERSSPELAALLAKDPGPFIRAIKDTAGTAEGSSATVLPPVLPLMGRAEILSALETALGGPVYELLSLPPSVPGLRLVEHLRRRAEALGIEMRSGEVYGFAAEGKTITSLKVKAGGGEESIGGDAFILAAGKFLAHGLRKDGAISEPIFNLPVSAGDLKAGRKVFTEKLLGLHVSGPHPLFAAGLQVDRRLRPLDREGNPASPNLFAAGAILAAHNYLRDGAGSGVSVATGARAGQSAAELLLP